MAEAIDAVERAFGRREEFDAPLRSHVPLPEGDLLAMPATGPPGHGVKLVTVTPSNPGRGLPLIHALYVLFEADSLRPVAVMDGSSLTALRTAAVSGVATRHVARPDASRLVIFGAGVQATSHLEAMLAVRPVAEVKVVGRSAERAKRLVERAVSQGLAASVAGADAVACADIVCTCTTSREPLFDGSLLRGGTHVNAVGAYTPDARELDDTTIRRARVVVETREAALAEAGDLLMPMAAGRFRAEDITADLSEVVAGAPVRRSPDDITVFKSVGVAFEDLAVAGAALGKLSP